MFTMCFVYFSTICFTICLFISPDLDGHRAQGTKNEMLSHRDPQKVSRPKYEATALCSHRSIGYPNPTNGQYSPDLDGYRALKLTDDSEFHDMFVH